MEQYKLTFSFNSFKYFPFLLLARTWEPHIPSTQGEEDNACWKCKNLRLAQQKGERPLLWSTEAAAPVARWPIWQRDGDSWLSFVIVNPIGLSGNYVLGQQCKVHLENCCVKFMGSIKYLDSVTPKPLLHTLINCPWFCLLTWLRLKKYICSEGLCFIAVVGLHCVVPSLPFQIQTLWG